jgi:hypothetical protein
MPIATLYTIKTTSGPVQAYDYKYTPTGLLIYALCNDLETLQPVPVEITWNQYQGINAYDHRVKSKPAPTIQADPEPLPQNTTPARKFKMSKIEIARGEGPSAECGKTATVLTWAGSDRVIQQWAKTAPGPNQGYDKCDFIVTWENGETYTGRFDMRQHDTGYSNHLPRHIRNLVAFYAGLEKPDHMTPAQYRQFLASETTPAEMESARQWLEQYALTDDPNQEPAPVLEQTPEPTTAPDPEPTPEPKTPNLSSVLDNLKLKF